MRARYVSPVPVTAAASFCFAAIPTRILHIADAYCECVAYSASERSHREI